MSLCTGCSRVVPRSRPDPKTIADAWTVLPYENQIVTLELTRDDLLALVRDLPGQRDVRNAMGLQPVLGGPDQGVVDVRSADGSPLPVRPRYRVALNSYDSQSGGQRLLQVARLAAAPANRRVLYPMEIRAALIEFFVSRQKVTRASLLV